MSDERFREIEKRLAKVETAIAVDAVGWQNIVDRLEKIEGTQTWLVRLIIGAILTAFIVFALSGGMKV